MTLHNRAPGNLGRREDLETGAGGWVERDSPGRLSVQESFAGHTCLVGWLVVCLKVFAVGCATLTPSRNRQESLHGS